MEGNQSNSKPYSLPLKSFKMGLSPRLLIIVPSIALTCFRAYLNEADIFETDPVNTFWGAKNYERLVGIKKELDPGNLLTCWDCIGWDPTDERYGCYPSL